MNRLLIGVLILTGIYSNSLAQTNPLTYETNYFKPERIIKKSEHSYFIDFGKAYFGTIYLNASSVQEDSVVIHLAEKLSELNSIDRNPPGSVRYQKVMVYNIDTSPILLPITKNERNTNSIAIQLPDSFGAVMPFRYCEIENLQIPIEDIEIYQKAFYYRFNDDASFFASSDSVLNQVWDLCKHTIKATTFTGYYVDGDRERIPYEADAYINQLSHYCADSVYSIARRTNQYFIDHATWPTEWLLHTVMLFYQDYMYTGDLSSFEKQYDVLKLKTLQDLANQDGLISSASENLTTEMKIQLGFQSPKAEMKDIVDWPPERGNTGKKWLPEFGERDNYDMVEINTVVNSFFYHNMILMSKIALALDKPDDAKEFSEKSERVRVAINKKLFDETRGIYIDGEGSEHASLHANMFPLAFGLVPDEHQESVVDFIKSRGMACSVYGAQYLLEALFIANESEYALHLITDTTHDRTWWNMIAKGSTMTWEAWDQKYKPNLDWNHAWGTAPLNIISRHLWGVTPQTPGYKHIQLRPQMADLTHSEIKVPTINGCIYARYNKTPTNIAIFEIELPTGTEGSFLIPKNYEVVPQSNNLKISGGTIKLNEGKNLIKLKG